MSVYKVYKNLGETPLECLERIRLEKFIDSSVSMTYAGRLDPAAEGEIYIITAEDIAHKDNYLGLDKIYEVEYILGASTDTGDLLGILKSNINSQISVEDSQIKTALNSLTGERQQAFHAFSSKSIGGKPLWLHSRNGNEVSASHRINIKRLELVSLSQISASDIYSRVLHITNLVRGDFRQKEILNSWENFNDLNITLPIVKIYANVSTGTYMRVLGEELSQILNIPVCAYSIIRKEIIT